MTCVNKLKSLNVVMYLSLLDAILLMQLFDENDF